MDLFLSELILPFMYTPGFALVVSILVTGLPGLSLRLARVDE